jgi:hypothetical protein
MLREKSKNFYMTFLYHYFHFISTMKIRDGRGMELHLVYLTKTA